MKTTIIAISALAVSVIAFGYIIFHPSKQNFGSSLGSYATFDNVTNTSSSIPTVATTTSPILSPNGNRVWAYVCNNGAIPVYLFPRNQSTTTGEEVNKGVYLSPATLTTSTANVCIDLRGFTGYLFGLASATTTVTVSYSN